VAQFQKSNDEVEWRISQEDKTLLIRGKGRMTITTQTKLYGKGKRAPFCQ